MVLSSAHESLRDQVAGREWYHTLELAPGVVTPGWFDLRPVADKLPWPDLTGRPCLDVGTFDGFWAFAMARRGGLAHVAPAPADAARPAGGGRPAVVVAAQPGRVEADGRVGGLHRDRGPAARAPAAGRRIPPPLALAAHVRHARGPRVPLRA